MTEQNPNDFIFESRVLDCSQVSSRGFSIVPEAQGSVVFRPACLFEAGTVYDIPYDCYWNSAQKACKGHPYRPKQYEHPYKRTSMSSDEKYAHKDDGDGSDPSVQADRYEWHKNHQPPFHNTRHRVWW